MKIESLSARTRALLESTEGVASNALAAAAKELKEKQAKEAQARALSILERADSLLTQKVATLRAIRKQEEAAKEDVNKFDSALEAFTKDGDVNKFAKDAGVSLYALTGSHGF